MPGLKPVSVCALVFSMGLAASLSFVLGKIPVFRVTCMLETAAHWQSTAKLTRPNLSTTVEAAMIYPLSNHRNLSTAIINNKCWISKSARRQPSYAG